MTIAFAPEGNSVCRVCGFDALFNFCFLFLAAASSHSRTKPYARPDGSGSGSLRFFDPYSASPRPDGFQLCLIRGSTSSILTRD